MAKPRNNAPGGLPRWLIAAGSVAIFLHLSAVVALALSAPSGPWPTPFGSSMATGPQFALGFSEAATRYYLTPLKMTHNYHFLSNRPAPPGAFFEVRLKDDTGKLMKTLRFPEENASFWVRHRQELLARALADDQPVQARPGEVLAAPHQKVQTVEIWDMGADRILQLRAVPEHLVPRDHPVFRPSPASLVLAHSYVRHLCRLHGAASGELLRHTKEPILPAILFMDEPPPGTFDELVSNFGETSR